MMNNSVINYISAYIHDLETYAVSKIYSKLSKEYQTLRGNTDDFNIHEQHDWWAVWIGQRLN